MRNFCLFLLCMISIGVVAQDFPAAPDPPRLVNDLAGLMSSRDQQQLEAKLTAYNDSTSTQIAVVTVNSLNGYDIAGYSFELAEQWGIGQQGQDNGLLILIAPNERRMFIATGYGLEAYVPDAIAKRIVEGTLKPNFQQEAYYRGLDQATNLLMGLLSGHFSPQQLEEDTPATFPFFLTVLLFILVMYFISRMRRGSGYRTPPGGHTYRGPIGRGPTWTDFSGGRGTFGGGGGFGGFGGGSFGGGGAGGSW